MNWAMVVKFHRHVASSLHVSLEHRQSGSVAVDAPGGSSTDSECSVDHDEDMIIRWMPFLQPAEVC